MEHKRFKEALDEVEKLGEDEGASETPDSRIDPVQIGTHYIKHDPSLSRSPPHFFSRQRTLLKLPDCGQLWPKCSQMGRMDIRVCAEVPATGGFRITMLETLIQVFRQLFRMSQ